jgi:hypothetical protein
MGTLPTSGGARIDIQGKNFGFNSSAIVVTYEGGSQGLPHRIYTALDCVLSPESVTNLVCRSVPGVGAHFRFSVRVGASISDPSADTLSYSLPVLSYVDLPTDVGPFPARGGVYIVFHGVNLGPNDTVPAPLVTAVGSTANVPAGMEVTTSDCAVVQSHVAIRCKLGSGVGAVVTWVLTVEGLASTRPFSSFRGPLVSRVWLQQGPNNVSEASNQGGTTMVITGENLGPSGYDNLVAVTASVPAAGLNITLMSCTIVSNDTILSCVVPPGTGALSEVQVTVGGQSGTLLLPPYSDTPGSGQAGVRYSSPVVDFVSTASGRQRSPTNLAVVDYVVTGAGFGPAPHKAPVEVTMKGTTACSTAPVVLLATDVVVHNDARLTFRLQQASRVPHVVHTWTVVVNVSGSVSTASGLQSQIVTEAPSVAAVRQYQADNGTHWFMEIEGNDFGATVGSNCAGDIHVSIGGQPCAELAMVQVGP